MPRSAPSGRSSGDINLSFGVINVPTTLYSGTVSAHGVQRNEYVTVKNDDGAEVDHPVGRGQIDKVTGELLEPGTEVIKKIQTEYGPVYVEDSEIEQLFSLAPNTLVVKEFEPAANMQQGHYVPKGLMFIEPRKSGSGRKKAPDPIATKIMVTLLTAMKKRNALAVCELTTRGVPKPCILMPDGRLWLIYHTEATREQREFPETVLVDAEVDMMGTLIDAKWADEPLDVADERSALIQGFADDKAAAGDFGRPEEEAGAVVAAPAATPDLMALLAASVETAKAERAAS